ncbi:tyrosine-protein phosphatase [Pseudomonas sp. nanlin1]|uniref:tyrosine-protein phosphatase n=1 Tax=Pseudomonas sp. nanlin1 TaxID=3040605 RepID=UPI00388D3D31
MIDLHSHLLPGIDDGADNMQDALEMAAHAVACGTTHMLCTPHLHEGRYSNDAASIAAALRGFRDALEQAGVPLQVSAGAEARFDSQLMTLAKNHQLPFLGEWDERQVLLLEFPHARIPAHAEKLTGWLLKNGIQPLIAHPERNRGLMGEGNHQQLTPFLDQGCLLQVTAGSLTGNFGSSAQALAERLLLDGNVCVIASDAHNMRHRPPNLLPGLEQAIRLVGESAARKLVQDNPWRIVRDQFKANAA